MFKEEFNSLFVAVNDFILNESISKTFSESKLEVTYFKNRVDEYNTLLNQLNVLYDQIDSALKLEVTKIKNDLKWALDRYKQKSPIVRAYLHELEIKPIKENFASKLLKFEKMIITKPVIKIDVEEINRVLAAGKEYVDATTRPYFYFTNNPLEKTSFGVIIPVKYSFENSNDFITSAYNYMYALYSHFINTYKIELQELTKIEQNVEHMIYDFSTLFKRLREKHNLVLDEPKAKYDSLESIKNEIQGEKSKIVIAGVYRFTRLVSILETILGEIDAFILRSEGDDSYKRYNDELDFYHLLEKFSNYILLLEDGKIQSDTDYVISDTNIKELTLKIISAAKDTKRKIKYTQKYHESGRITTLEFEFYQTNEFLESVKLYYYDLMTKNFLKFSKIGIDDYGDATLDDMRNEFKLLVARYKSFISKEISHFNDFEFGIFLSDVVKIQDSLKISAKTFYSAAKKLSLPTYIEAIDNDYRQFIVDLDFELKDLKEKRVSDTISFTEKNKKECFLKLVDLYKHTDKLKKMIELSKENVFFGFDVIIETKMLPSISELKDELTEIYNFKNYDRFLNIYKDFFNKNIIDFNLFYSLEKFSSSVTAIYLKIEQIEKLYMYELTKQEYSDEYDIVVGWLSDLFDDETYKVIRYELYADLDITYDFIISNNPIERSFYLNEKNLKKMYFDNQLMRMNYIYWYHKIIGVKNEFNELDDTILKMYEFFEQNKDIVENIEEKERIESLVVIQSRVMSEIKKMLIEYNPDVNYNVEMSSNAIVDINAFDTMIEKKFREIQNVLKKFKNILRMHELNSKLKVLTTEHMVQWKSIILDNHIPEPEKISYNEMDAFTGNVPFTVGLRAQLETVVDASKNEVSASFKWFIGSKVIEGDQAVYTFYESGEHTVSCVITYPNGESFTKFLKFDLGGAKNSQMVRVGKTIYSPLTTNLTVPKITFMDPKTRLMRTLPLNVSQDISEMIGNGSITFSTDSMALKSDNYGWVIYGYHGIEFPGVEFQTHSVFDEKFVSPEKTPNEFLFDFRMSVPLSGNVSIDITDSKFSIFMAKLPYDIGSVYEVKKASAYTNGSNRMHVIAGDRLVFRNKSERYAIIEIKNITTKTSSAEQSANGLGDYQYEVEFDYFVNVSVNSYERDIFRPTETNLTVPTLIFKTDVRELFNSTIKRLELINSMMEKNGDLEYRETTNAEIAVLNQKNSDFYLFNELDKIKSIQYSLSTTRKKIFDTFSLNVDYDDITFENRLQKFSKHLNSTRNFKDYMRTINAYNFKQNIVDLDILIQLYKMQQISLEIIIDTFTYKSHDISFFVERLKKLTLFDTATFIDKKEKNYGKILVNLVKKLRELFFRIKLIINFPIMTSDRYLIMDSDYKRLKSDLSTNIWKNEEENDLFLLHKKLEMVYGFEVGKVEEGNDYISLISDVVLVSKNTFGNGLSIDDRKELSTYIQKIESLAVSEYDDFFMLSLWLDYLEKNV